MIKLGDNNILPLLRLDDKGGWLEAGEYGEAFLPRRQLPKHCQPGDNIAVFIYLDSDQEPVITTDTPKALAYQFASLKVVTTNRLGAFLDWGMKKDIFVPQRSQARPMEAGRHYVVYLYLDHEGRMVASSRLDSFLCREHPSFRVGDEVDLLVAEQTDLGFKAIVNSQFWGLLFRSDISGRVPMGLQTKGYVKRVRDDGKIDLTLFKPGPGKVDDAAQAVLDKLARAGGSMQVNDKTDPDTIFRMFGISKGTFKKAIGSLYKQGHIVIEAGGIRSTDTPK